MSGHRCSGPLLALAVALTGCGGATTPSPPPPPPPPAGVITIAPSTGNATVQQGAAAAITVLVNRTNFTGPVTVAVEGLPTGVTAPQSNETTAGSGTTITITFTASGSAVPGRTTLTLRARGSGVTDATTTFDLTITAAPVPGYDLTVTGSPVSVPQGGNGQATVTIARSGGFAGAVTLTVEGAPPGLAVSVSPSPTAGTSATVTVVAAAGLASATYPLTIRGTAAGLPDETTTMQVTVTAVTASGNAVFDFTQCPSPYVVWAAYRDGSGAWTRVTPTAKVFRFTITSPVGTFAYVVQQGGAAASTTNVQFMTRAEFSAAPFTFCPSLPINSKVVSGVVNGLTQQQAAFLTLGGAFSQAGSLFPTFNLVGVPSGDRDLVGYRLGGLPTTADRIIIRRDQNIASGGSLGALDFGTAEAVIPATGTLTVSGLAGGEALLETMTYLTRSSCDPAMLYQVGAGTSNRTMIGVPPSLQRPDDFHMVKLAASTATTSRYLQESFHTMANRTTALGGVLGSPAVTVLAGTYKRLEATFGLPLEYTSSATFRYLQTSGTPRIVQLVATPGWVGALSATLTMPDFTGVAGWLDSWAPGAAVTAPWTITAAGGDVGTSSCREGARVIQATASGSN